MKKKNENEKKKIQSKNDYRSNTLDFHIMVPESKVNFMIRWVCSSGHELAIVIAISHNMIIIVDA